MPSQSALELRSEHWSARARGRHDRDEIVTLLWQRVPAGADNSRRDWSGTPPAAAGSRWRATDVVRREYRRRPAARMARRVRSTTDASTSSGARRSCKVERKLGGARSTSAAVPSMCSRHKRRPPSPRITVAETPMLASCARSSAKAILSGFAPLRMRARMSADPDSTPT